jgi:glycosyltransferase involved in cell wall biosynthesis
MFEYMAASRPVVATELPGITDVLYDEENALVVPPDDSRSLREAIRRLREEDDLAVRLAERARADVEQYTWELRAERIVTAAERAE